MSQEEENNDSKNAPIIVNLIIKAKAGLSILQVNREMSDALLKLGDGWEVATFNVGHRTQSHANKPLPPKRDAAKSQG